MQVKSRKNIVAIVSIFTFPLFFILFFSFSNVKKIKKLRTNGEMAIGVVDSVYLRNTTDLVEHWFSGSFYIRKNKEKIIFTNTNINIDQKLNKGDKVLIYYENNNPTNYFIDIDSETNAYYKYFYFELVLFFVGALLILYQCLKIKSTIKSSCAKPRYTEGIK